MQAAADRITTSAVEQMAARYMRERDLPKLFPNWPTDLPDGEVITRLTLAVTAGRKAVATGHWTADTNRLLALRAALLAERTP